MIIRDRGKRLRGKRLIISVAIVLLVAAVVGVLATGCGSSSTATTTTAAAATTTTAAAATTTTAAAATTTTAAAAATTTTAAAALSASLNGAGATFPQPVYVAWIGAFQSLQPGVKINYQGVGSGAGITQFTAQTLDFGASDAFMKDTEIAAAVAARPGAKVIQVPTVFGSITLAYNLPELKTPLKLDSDTLCNILQGKITKWNDPAIAALNAGATLPTYAIQTVHRSDSSGTTNAFTSYLAAVNAAWKTSPGVGKTVKWPNGVGGPGNAGVAALITQTKGAIGYVELAYALSNNMTVAQMKNAAGNFITPNLDSTTAAADLATFPADFNLLPVVSNSANPQAYPIVTSTYVLAYDKMPDSAKAAALRALLTWALGPDGTAIAKGLGYAPLTPALAQAALTAINAIGAS